jgi:hypothetical protein
VPLVKQIRRFQNHYSSLIGLVHNAQAIGNVLKIYYYALCNIQKN